MNLDELAEIALPILEEREKSLVGDVAIDRLRSSQSALLHKLGGMDPKLAAQGIKEYKSLMGSFKEELVTLIKDVKSGSLGQAEAFSKWKKLTGQYYSDIFRSGAKATGNIFYAKMGLTKQDASFISGARREEGQYFKKFLGDIESGAGKIDYETRAGFYGDSASSQFFNGQIAGYGDNIKIRWVLEMFAEHCSDCPSLAAQTYTWKTLPFVPRSGNTKCLFRCKCFCDGRQGIMTDRGVRRISKIAVGDRVLAHTGKFEDVTAAWTEPYEDAIFVVGVESHGRPRKYKVTKGHNFMLPDGSWIDVSQLKVGDSLMSVVQKCPQCSGLFVLSYHMPQECCSKKCEAKYNGKRKTEAANEATRALVKLGECSLQKSSRRRKGKTYAEIYGEGRVASEKSKRPQSFNLPRTWYKLSFEEKYGKEKAAAIKAKLSAHSKGKTYEELAVNVDPNEWRRKVILPPFKMSSIERIVESELAALGIEFRGQEWVGRYRADFYIPSHKIAIECDGDYWHSSDKQKASDRARDIFFRSQGIAVLRFTETEIRKDPGDIRKRIGFTLLNHTGNFVSSTAVVTSIAILPGLKRKSYQITVANAHSYAAWEGVVSKNCHLEFEPAEESLGLPIMPGKGTLQALTSPGKYAEVYGPDGNRITGELERTMDDLYAQMYKARQMISSAPDLATKQEWIQIRKALNKAIIQAKGNFRVIPTISVKQLVTTVKSAMELGGVITPLESLVLGDEVLFVRGDFSAYGVVKFVANQIKVATATGMQIPVSNDTDLVFVLKKSVTAEQLLAEGGPGSGNFGHSGREGEVGGSGDSIGSEADGWLQSWQWTKMSNPMPSDTVLKQLRSYIPEKPVVLYRAALHKEPNTQIKSWTANKEYAATMVDGSGGERRLMTKKFYPDEIVVSTDRLPAKYKELFTTGTDETIVAYGSLLKKMKEIRKRESLSEGGEGSGNFGHSGREGEVGGSGESFTSASTLKSEYEGSDGVPFAKEGLSIVGYRVGSIDDKHRRGVFFGAEHGDAAQYADLHPGSTVVRYAITFKKVLVAGHQNSVTQLLFKKSYNQMMSGGVEGGRKFDVKVAAAARKLGYDGIIYTRPAPPASFEIVSLNPKNFRQDEPVSEALHICESCGKPHSFNKQLVKKLLGKSDILFAEWQKIYDKHCVSSVFPLERTWMEFKELYSKDHTTGQWSHRFLRETIVEGGQGSGNFGHGGRPGEVGGSGEGGGSSFDDSLAKFNVVQVPYGASSETSAIRSDDVFGISAPKVVLGLSSFDKKKFSAVDIQLTNLAPTQEFVNVGGLRAYAVRGSRPKDGDPEIPRVALFKSSDPGLAKLNGRYIILSGHTRLAAAIIRGDKTFKVKAARVFVPLRGDYSFRELEKEVRESISEGGPGSGNLGHTRLRDALLKVRLLRKKVVK